MLNDISLMYVVLKCKNHYYTNLKKLYIYMFSVKWNIAI